MNRVTYLGDARVGRYECAVFRATQDQRYEGSKSSRKTAYVAFPVTIDSVTIERTRTVYLAREEGKVIAYDARHRTQAEFAVQTPMGDRRLETDARTRWAMILHDGLKFVERASAD